MAKKDYPRTPDGRYFVSRARLWRCTDPGLDDSTRRAAVKALMQARRAVQLAGDDGAAQQAARADVDAAKRRLGERGPVWWDDGAPDEGGMHPARSSYADWWAALDAEARARGE
ncbi:hypothetical protein DC366_04150 [Pelagivirga sediminicola]|uniref:Uncharacterized protein n=1 Tax=Pelagivirga sediminicola TaxID=2170575 RepID=A0A2T7G989_9RHOB|nr:hypothetical protein [Pelagivirga sediminicola]PVA10984.1 hypothetical protein DC366_04150 [Pelagivirga sediminicola]